MYRVLYRKWRPQTFGDVTGQPQVTETLKQELVAGRIAHAYLFTGSRGTGKTTCAKILAKAINCLQPQNGEPCGTCEICRGIDQGSVTDVVEIDAASNNGVDHIRMLREEAGFTPAMAKYRVYIIDEVHMLSIGAFNALLKTLEEPPAHVVFILATTEVHKMPATILSRCQRFEFRRISPADSAERLRYIAQEEGAQLDEDAALLIARLADGALRDALSILDQCIGVNSHVTEDVVCGAVGTVGREHLYRLTQAVVLQDSAGALDLIDRLHSGSKDMTRLCEEMIAHFRNLMLLKTVKDAKALIPVSDEEFRSLTGQAADFSLTVLLHGLETMQTALEKIYRGANGRITMEMAMIRLCTPQLDTGTEALLRRIEALERGALAAPPAAALPEQTAPAAGTEEESGEPCQPPAAAAEQAAPPSPGTPSFLSESDKTVPPWETGRPAEAKPAAPKQPAAKKQKSAAEQPKLGDTVQPLAEWPEILQILGGYSKAIATAFTDTSAFVSGDYVLIDAPPDSVAFELLRKSSQREQMREAIRQSTGRVYKLGPYKPREEADTAQTDPLQQLAEQAEQAGIDVEIKEN